MLLRFIFSVRRGCGFFHTSPEFFSHSLRAAGNHS